MRLEQCWKKHRKRWNNRQTGERKKWKNKKKRQSNVEYNDLVFKKRPAKKLVGWYVGSYFIDEVISTNIVKLWLFTSIRIHVVVNVSQIV